MPDIKKSGDRYLDQEIDDLLSVDSTKHTDTDNFKNLKLAIGRLTDCVSKYYPKDNEAAPKLGKKELDEIRRVYSEAIRECANYTNRWFARRSGLGAGREACVNSLRRLLEQDLQALNAVKPADDTDLSSVISSARTEYVETDVAEQDLKVYGESVSTRVPLAVETATGVRKGFFTEDYFVRLPMVFCRELINEYKLEPQNKNDLGCILKKVMNFGSSTMVNNDLFHNLVFQLLDTEEARKKNGLTLDELEKDPGKFAKHYQVFCQQVGMTNALFTQLQQSQELRRKFINLTQDLFMYGLNFVNNKYYGGIPENKNVPVRNVAVTRTADLLGMGGIVARSVRMTFQDKDGTVRNGVFQETVEGSDVHHVKKYDPLLEIANNPEMLDDPEVLKMIADMQLLDYICGCNDRHEGNVMFDVREVNGKMKIVGIKAIDNDRAFGIIDFRSASRGGYITPPDQMGIISASAYGALTGLDEKTLKTALQDLGISGEEIAYAMRRISDVKNAVQKDKLKVVEDKDFANYKYKDLCRSWTFKDNPKIKKDNLFTILWSVPQNAAKVAPMKEGAQVQYNTAKAKEGRYERVNTDLKIYLSDLKAQRDALEGIDNKLKAADSILHKDGATFKWMKTSLKNAIDAIKALDDSYKAGAGERTAITADEAEKMESLFRQVRLSAGKYYSEHPSPGYSLGRARTDAARDLRMMRPLRCTEPAVMNIAMDQIKTDQKEKPAPAVHKKTDEKQHPLAKSIRVKKQKNNDLLNGMQQN